MKTELLPNAQPRTIFTLRQDPIRYGRKVEEELQFMETFGVISHVEKPTTWCSRMVVIQKNNCVQICVDIHLLNKGVFQEVYPLPKVDELLFYLHTDFFQVNGNMY